MKRLRKVANDSYYEAFINSVDDKSNFEIKDVVIEEDIKLFCKINTHKWSDGAPALKYYSIDAKSGELFLKKGDVLKVVHNISGDYMYTYQDGGWYRFDSSEVI